METVYKLTDKNGKTRPGHQNETQWGKNVTHTAPGSGELCSNRWLHAYSDPVLAVFMNSAHGQYDPKSMKLWIADAEVGLRKPDKLGCTKITTLHEILTPVITTPQRQAFAILAAKEVYKNKTWNVWADNWLNGKDRTRKSAGLAYADAANAAANAAAAAYAYADAEAADAAANAAAVRFSIPLDLVSLAHKAVKEF